MALTFCPVIRIQLGDSHVSDVNRVFPTNLFVGCEKDTEPLSCGTRSYLPVYNARHPFAEWLIAIASAIRQAAPKQFDAIVNHLMATFDAHWSRMDIDKGQVNSINWILATLGSGYHIDVPSIKELHDALM